MLWKRANPFTLALFEDKDKVVLKIVDEGSASSENLINVIPTPFVTGKENGLWIRSIHLLLNSQKR
ncbi:hypothetical protein KHA80_08275 [Anaerobacillus sp. HL2]|nr:hypothetical protein KHA80_08275 [Anaerobacillus sp. HL2]